MIWLTLIPFNAAQFLLLSSLGLIWYHIGYFREGESKREGEGMRERDPRNCSDFMMLKEGDEEDGR